MDTLSNNASAQQLAPALDRANPLSAPPKSPPALEALLTLDRVLEVIPISRELWWSGVKSGRFPAPIRLSPRTPAWRTSEIGLLVSGLQGDCHE
jgi:predicted DNA-binding transcriptional regulator AlpA